MQGQPESFVAGQPMVTDVSGAFSRIDLAAEVLESFGELRLRVTGSSMLPAIRPGDVLLIRRGGFRTARVGDVVLFQRHRRFFAHRVVSRTAHNLVTQGDGIGACDSPVAGSELLGRVHGVVRRGRCVPVSSEVTFAGRIAARLVRRSALAGRLLTRLHQLQYRAGL